MTRRSLPASAAALLERLLPRHDWDALIGDLHEERQRGRSRLWYVAQVLAAIVVGTWKDMRSHWALTLHATLVGFASGAASLIAYFYVVSSFYRAIEYLHSGILIGDHWIKWPDRWMPRNDFSMVLDTWFVAHAAFLTSGWLVGRFHRSYGVSMLVPYAALVALVFSQITYSGPTFNTFRFFLNSQAVTVPLSILIGGYCATRPSEAA